MYVKTLALSALLIISNPLSAEDVDKKDAAIGAGAGAAIGAVVGAELGNKKGAIIGGAIGAAVGVAVTTGDKSHHPEPEIVVLIQQPKPLKSKHCPPGQAKKGRC